MDLHWWPWARGRQTSDQFYIPCNGLRQTELSHSSLLGRTHQFEILKPEEKLARDIAAGIPAFEDGH